MARTAADRPTHHQAEASSPDQQVAARKRPNTLTPKTQTMSKTSRMETDGSPGTEPQGSNGKTRLSKGNHELFEFLKGYMDEKFDGLGGQMDSLKQEVSLNTGAIGGLSAEVKKNRGDIDKINAQIRDMKKKDAGTVSETQVERIVEKVLGAKKSGYEDDLRNITKEMDKMKQTAAGGEQSQENSQYWFARRGIRCWPVTGDSRKELLTSVGTFFGEKLRIPQSGLREEDIVEIRKIQARPRRPGDRGDDNRIRNEVVVVLREVQQRDMVFRHASNLSVWREGKHASDSAGIRLHVPTHLLGKFNTFNQHGFALRAKYGQGLKRHIRFEDTEMDLVMDVKLPEQDEWFRVDYQFALEETRINRKARTMNARGRLSSLQDNAGNTSPPAPRSAPPSLGAGRQQVLTRATRDQDDVFQWGRNA